MTSVSQAHLRMGLGGLGLGFVLSNLGFSDWAEVHAMFTFADLRLLLTFIGAVALSFLGFALLMRGRPLPHQTVHRGSIVGGVLFGAGWAVTGACPGIALVQLGEGRLLALVTVAGIVAGNLVHRAVETRVLHWAPPTCGE